LPSADQPINRDIIISKLMESVNPDKIALDRSANDELIFMTAYNLFCGVPGSLGRLTDLAIVSRGMVLVQNPDAFDPLFVESEIAELDVLIDTLRDLPDPDPYLFALALVTKGELLLQKADRTIDLAQAKKELKLAQKWFDDILAEDSLERIVIENYPTLLAKATVLRASLMTRGDLAASLEIWEIDAEVERLIPACSQFVPGTYLGTLADITLAELNIAQASKTQDPGALQEAKALLENVPSEYGYLYAKSRLLRGSILARQADSIDKQIIETAIQQIRAAANHFELNSYYDILADLTLGELNLALADKTDNRVYLDRANAAFESVLTLDAYDYIYNKAVVLDAVVAARREEEIDFGALNRSITYFEQKAPQGYILAQAYVTKGELLIQTTDRLENYASASTQLATTKAWFKEIREKAMLKKFNKLYAKATILEIALLIRQPELLKDAQIAVLSAQLTISLPFFKTGSYLHAMASLLQGELQLILANRGLETDANLRTAERFFSHKQLENYPHLHARALIKRVEIGIRKRRKASTLLSLCNQAREKLSAKDVHLNLESAHQKMTLLIMLNRPSHALKLANEVLATLATTQQLRTEQKTFFTLYAKLRKAEAYIQLSARQAQDALDLLKEIEKAICAPLPPYIYAKLKDIPAILDGTVGDGPQDSIKILDVAAQVLRSNEHYGLAAKLDQARSAAKKREYEETRRLTNEVLTELGPLDISQAFEESMRLLGWDLHSFRSELYHQTAIAYSIQGRRQADLTYEYANSACVEGKESKSSYDREERIKILFKLLKEPKTPCACTPEK